MVSGFRRHAGGIVIESIAYRRRSVNEQEDHNQRLYYLQMSVDHALEEAGDE